MFVFVFVIVCVSLWALCGNQRRLDVRFIANQTFSLFEVLCCWMSLTVFPRIHTAPPVSRRSQVRDLSALRLLELDRSHGVHVEVGPRRGLETYVEKAPEKLFGG